MVLAEALLRVPDVATADRLIEDKLAAGRWLDSDVKSTAILVSASAWTLGLAASIIHPGETPDSILDNVVRRLGLPAMRAATRQAMRILGSHFVIGQTIAQARARARTHDEFLYSFDMLGEGARTAAAAQAYFDAYADAIEVLGAGAGSAAQPRRRASACSRSSYRVLPRWRVSPRRTTCNSPSMRRRRTGLNCRWRLLRACSPIPRSMAGTVSGSRCRPIRSARSR
jgi:RHH-type proline utilization regulon transcriptional repressor/proline dehydrogenase/delta 1-pyrroline-5-carboxylate dehydrogenase